MGLRLFGTATFEVQSRHGPSEWERLFGEERKSSEIPFPIPIHIALSGSATRTFLLDTIEAPDERVDISANWQYINCQEADMAQLLKDPGPPPASPNLADAATRERLTPAAVDGMVRLAEIWRLTSTETCALLGDVSERTWFRMKKGEWTGSLSQDVLTRISATVGLFKALRLLFSEPLCDEWVRLPNNGSLYRGRRPLDVMIEGGIPAMLEVRRHIDALRGGL